MASAWSSCVRGWRARQERRTDVSASATTDAIDAVWQGWFDGRPEPNPGLAGIGGLLLAPDGSEHTFSEAIGYSTINEAQYLALLRLFAEATRLGARKLTVHGDSQLVLHQVFGDWACRKPHLQDLQRQAHVAMGDFASCTGHWVNQEFNQRAIALAQAALASPSQGPELTRLVTERSEAEAPEHPAARRLAP